MSKFASKDAQAAAAMLHGLGETPLPARVLVAGDTSQALSHHFERNGSETDSWLRRYHPDLAASPLPPPGPYSAAVYRVPAAREEALLGFSLLAGSLVAGAPLYFYGPKDEGIKSAAAKLPAAFEALEDLGAKHHCRTYRARRSRQPVQRPAISDLARRIETEIQGRPFAFHTLPGLFAQGRLDPGSQLLLETLADLDPPLSAPNHLVDYGSGAGVLSRYVAETIGFGQATLIDVDTMAGELLELNFAPGTPLSFVLAPSLSGALRGPGAKPVDLVLSNPPIHAGKRQTFEILERFLSDLPAALTAQGRALIVTQSTVPVPRLAAGGPGASLAIKPLVSTPQFTVHQLQAGSPPRS